MCYDCLRHILIQSVQDSSAETAGQFEASISKLNGEIERMAPNMKAMDRYGFETNLIDQSLIPFSKIDWKTWKPDLRKPSGRPIKHAGKRRKRVMSSMTFESEGSDILFCIHHVIQTKHRCDLFNKAFKHMQERIDPIYKDLTKGKAAPMGGVAYLSAEEYEVSGMMPFMYF